MTRFLLSAALILAAFPADAAEQIAIDGSSTVYPITEAVAEEFQTEKKGAVNVTVGISGTGGGFKKFCRGEIDVQNASRPILEKEMKDCREAGIKYVELPVAFDALTVVVNPKNDFVDKLTVAELKKMWEPAAQGKVKNWNQIRTGFPDAPLKLFGAGSDSGTFDYFTEAVVGKSKSSRGDYTASEDDNTLVQGVSNDKNAIGYFGFAYFEENKDKLKAVPIDGGKGPVSPALDAVIEGNYSPLSRPLFIYVSSKAAKKAEVKEFVEFYLKHAAELSKQVGYVPLPAKAYEMTDERFAKGTHGTAFGGRSQVGLKIEEILKRKPQM